MRPASSSPFAATDEHPWKQAVESWCSLPVETSHVEFFRRPPAQQNLFPEPLPEALQPSRIELEEMLRPLASAFFKPNLTHHGVAHGISSAILSAVICRLLPLQANPHNEKIITIATFLHDIGRVSDWEINQLPHARRGEVYVRKFGTKLLPQLSDEELSIIARAIGLHSTTISSRAEKRRFKKEIKAATNEQLAEKLGSSDNEWLAEVIVQEADTLDMCRGYYTGGASSSLPRAICRARAKINEGEQKPHAVERKLLFPQVAQLIPMADALAWMSRHPQTLSKFDGNILAATLHSAERLGILQQ